MNWIVRKDFVRFIPHINPLLLMNTTKTLKPNPREEFRHRTLMMYLYELPRLLRFLLRKRLKAPQPREYRANPRSRRTNGGSPPAGVEKTPVKQRKAHLRLSPQSQPGV